MDRRGVRETPKRTFAAVFLGAMMMVSGVAMILLHLFPLSDVTSAFHTKDGPFGYVSRGMLVLGGALILVLRKRGNYFAVGMYAMVLGISRVIRSLPGVISDSDPLFYLSMILVAIGVNLTVSGYNHITVRTKNPTTMRISALLMLGSYLVALVFIYAYKLNPVEVLKQTADILCYFPLYVSLLLILSSKEVMENIPMGRIRRYSASVGDRLYIGDSVSISAEDADVLKEGLSDTGGWQERTVAGMTVREKRITFRTNAGDRDVVLNTISGKEGLLLSVVDDYTDSFVLGKRFIIQMFSESDGVMRLYDSDGVCAVLNVRCVE